MLASVVLASLTAKDILGRDLGNRVLGFGSVTWATVLLLLASLRALRGVAKSSREQLSEVPSDSVGSMEVHALEQSEWTGEEQRV